MRRLLWTFVGLWTMVYLTGQESQNNPSENQFRQMGTEFATPQCIQDSIRCSRTIILAAGSKLPHADRTG